MNFRPRTRIKDTALLAALKLEHDCCEVTGETHNLHLHHVVFKSHGGDDIRSNIVCLHQKLHDDYHAAKEEARYQVGRYIRTFRPDTMLYLQEKLGSATALVRWMERHGIWEKT
jgi:5-methylcytosine-specific restriction endonuclease McrA